MYYEAELGGLVDTIYGIEQEIESWAGIMASNEDDMAGQAYEQAYTDYGDFEDDLAEALEDEWEFEEDLAELELENLWDDTAAAYD